MDVFVVYSEPYLKLRLAIDAAKQGFGFQRLTDAMQVRVFVVSSVTECVH